MLVVSSAAALASEIEIALGPQYEVHAAATDDAAGTLLNIHEYDCVVLDVRPASSAGLRTAKTLRTDYPTILFCIRPDDSFMKAATVVVESDVDIAELAAAITSMSR